MTPSEFDSYNLAYRIRRQETIENLAIQAWFNQTVQAQENKGSKKKPRYESKYKSFEDFYDGDKQFREIFNPSKKEDKPKKLSLADKNRLLSKRRKGDTDE